MSNTIMTIAKWMMVASFLLLLAGAIGIAFIDNEDFEFYDPDVTNLTKLSPESSESIYLESTKIYVALRIDDGISNASLKLINNSGDEYEGRSANWLDLPRTGIDNTVYMTVRVFEISSEGDYILFNEGNNTLWFVDETANQFEIFNESYILLVSLSCCMGIPIGFIALFLGIVGWRKEKKNINLIIDNQSGTELEYRENEIRIITDEERIPEPFIEKKDISLINSTKDGLNLKHVDNASEYNEENKKLKNDTYWEEWDNDK
ncbi:hypothetical protein N8653_01970 [Euryarchaeota archaeon]|nr:hypothetical protein [Euryarchaeota archaeon]